MAVTTYESRLAGDFRTLDPAEYMTLREAMRTLNRSEVVLWRRRRRGDLHAVKYNGRPFFRRSDVETMRERQDWLYGAKVNGS